MSYEPVSGLPGSAPVQPPAYAAPVAPADFGSAVLRPPRQNQLAIVALVLGFVASLGGIICGHIALSQIKRTGDDGRGIALTGLIVGYVFTAFWVLYIAFYITFLAVLLPTLINSFPSGSV